MDEERTPSSHPHEREKDKQPVSSKEVKRDIWLFLISALVLIAVIVSIRGSDKAQHAVSSTRVLIDQNRRLAIQARNLAIKFQNQRIENIRSNCIAQNKRHDNTIRALDRALKIELKNLPRGQVVTKEQIKANRASTIFIIDALQPHQKCSLLVARAEGKKVSIPTTPPRIYIPPIIPNPDNQSRTR